LIDWAPSERTVGLIFSLVGAVVKCPTQHPRVVGKFVCENVSVNVDYSLLTSPVVDLLMDMTTAHDICAENLFDYVYLTVCATSNLQVIKNMLK